MSFEDRSKLLTRSEEDTIYANYFYAKCFEEYKKKRGIPKSAPASFDTNTAALNLNC